MLKFSKALLEEQSLNFNLIVWKISSGETCLLQPMLHFAMQVPEYTLSNDIFKDIDFFQVTC